MDLYRDGRGDLAHCSLVSCLPLKDTACGSAAERWSLFRSDWLQLQGKVTVDVII